MEQKESINPYEHLSPKELKAEMEKLFELFPTGLGDVHSPEDIKDTLMRRGRSESLDIILSRFESLLAKAPLTSIGRSSFHGLIIGQFMAGKTHILKELFLGPDDTYGIFDPKHARITEIGYFNEQMEIYHRMNTYLMDMGDNSETNQHDRDSLLHEADLWRSEIQNLYGENLE